MPAPTPLNCPVCNTVLNAQPSNRDRPGLDGAFYDCPRCGNFGLSGTAMAVVPKWLEDAPDKIPVFSYTLRKMQTAEEWPLISSDVCKRIIETVTLPTPHEQADNLIRWLGENSPGPGELVRLTSKEHSAIIGAKTDAGLPFVVDGLANQELIKASIDVSGGATVRLTLAGWARYEELRRGASSGRTAFMAMQYNDPSLDQVVDGCFRPAVQDTGFVLKRLDDEPKAGLIDDRLRVEIQSARFLIVDLTHGNKGAYWEAGYAEGLQKPVIYTCEQARFNEESHFDTNHHLTVLWTEDGQEDASKRLKDTIRATIPEAKREDG